jgi:hypothetical protein
MNPDQKRRTDDKVTARFQHCVHIPRCPIRPQKMLKYLVSYDDVKLPVQPVFANVKLRIRCGSETPEAKFLPFVASGYFQRIQL